MDATTTISAFIEQHFTKLLLERNHGLIAVVADSRTHVIVVALSTEPFLIISFGEASINLQFSYPRSFHYGESLKHLPKERRARAETLVKLANAKLHQTSPIIHASYDLFKDGSIQQAEFVIQTIITKIKYMVSNDRWYGLRLKKNVELTDLVAAATLAFITHETRKKRTKP